MKKMMVIVVDDNLVSRLLPSFILRPYGTFVNVVECEGGPEALRLMQTHSVTHVLLDISMPGMDGVELAKQIRSFAKASDVRLIAYTANALAADASHLKSMGFDDVLLKPLKSADLLHALNISS